MILFLRIRSRWYRSAAASVPFIFVFCAPLPAQLETKIAVRVMTLGAEEGPNATVFGDVSGLELTSDGRMIVVDRLGPAVLIFGQGGTVEHVLDQRGAGPGDFTSPCCVALSEARGELWVVDPQLNRLTVFDWPSLAFARVVRPPSGATIRPHRPMFLEEGGTAISAHGGTSSTAYIHLVLSADGEWSRTVRLPPGPPPDSIGFRGTIARLPKGDGEFIEIGQSPPFSPQWLLIRGPGGAFARGVTSRFALDLFSPEGSIVGRIERDVQGPMVSDVERSRAERRLDSLATSFEMRGGSYPDLSVPNRKPPVHAAWFDRGGNLWIQQALAAEDPLASAVVFDPSGHPLFEARWPSEVRLYLGVIRSSTALGIIRDSNDVEAVVRLEFRREMGQGESH